MVAPEVRQSIQTVPEQPFHNPSRPARAWPGTGGRQPCWSATSQTPLHCGCQPYPKHSGPAQHCVIHYRNTLSLLRVRSAVDRGATEPVPCIDSSMSDDVCLPDILWQIHLYPCAGKVLTILQYHSIVYKPECTCSRISTLFHIRSE